MTLIIRRPSCRLDAAAIVPARRTTWNSGRPVRLTSPHSSSSSTCYLHAWVVPQTTAARGLSSGSGSHWCLCQAASIIHQ